MPARARWPGRSAPQAATESRCWMRAKRIVIIGGGLVLLLFVAVLAAVWLVDIDGYRQQVQTLLRDRLNRDVTIGHIALNLRPLGVRVQDTVIAEAPAL